MDLRVLSGKSLHTSTTSSASFANDLQMRRMRDREIIQRLLQHERNPYSHYRIASASSFSRPKSSRKMVATRSAKA